MPLAHRVDPDLGEELETGARRVDRRDRRRAVLEPSRARAVVEMLHIERERLLHSPPADRARARALGDAGARVQERDPGPAHEPFQRAAHEVVDPAGRDVEGDRANGLVRVDDEDRAFAVADLRERADVLDPAGREIHVPGANRRGRLVHGTFEELERYADAVGATDKFDAGAAIGDGEERVTVGREIEVGHDHLRPFGVVERARDADEPGRDVRLDGDLVHRSTQKAGQLLTERLVLADPVVVPGAPALLRPLSEKPLDPFAAAPVQRGQRAVVQIIQAVGDRELRPPGFLDRIGHHPAT